MLLDWSICPSDKPEAYFFTIFDSFHLSKQLIAISKSIFKNFSTSHSGIIVFNPFAIIISAHIKVKQRIDSLSWVRFDRRKITIYIFTRDHIFRLNMFFQLLSIGFESVEFIKFNLTDLVDVLH